MEDDSFKRGPYKGLVPYTAADAAFFFGRENETRLIIANLFASPLTLLYGDSGVGKSSILNAGVSYELNQRRDVCPVVFTEWARNPLEGLKKAVVNALTPRVRSEEHNQEQLPSLTDPLPEFLTGYSKCYQCRLAIILDQFEDYLQSHPLHSPFGIEFASAFLESKAPFSFLIAIREDALARLDRFEGSIPNLFDNYLRLEPLDRRSGRVAIEAPLRKYNELYPEEGPYTVEPELCEAVLQQVKREELGLGLARESFQKEPRKHEIDTVYLQLVMKRLWLEERRQGSLVLRRRTLDALQVKQKIVTTHLNEVMDHLTEEEKDIASRVLKYLVTPSGSRVAYPLNELADTEKIDKQKLSNVLNKLSLGENRILRPVVTSPDQSVAPTYEIFHPALGLAILDWRNRLLDEEFTQAAQKAQAEIQRQLDRKRKQLITLFVAFCFVVLLMICATAAGIHIYRLQRATEEAQQRAVESTNQVIKLKGEADEYITLVKAQDLAVPDTKAVMRWHKAAVTSVAFNKSESHIVTGSEDGSAIVWEADGNMLRKFEGHVGPVQAVAFSPDGKYILTGGYDNTVRLWNRFSDESTQLWEHSAPITSVAFSHDGKYFVSASADQSARIWEVGQKNSIHVLRGHSGPIYDCEFSPDDSLVLTASADRTARLWDSRTGALRYTLNEHRDEVTRATFDVQGKRVATASKDNTARIWDTASGQRLHVLSGHTKAVNDVSFSQDGKYVVTASADNTARIYTANGTPYAVLTGHAASVNSARFSSDGERVITSSDDKTARTWKAGSQSGALTLVELKGHTDAVTNALFAHNNKIALTISADQTARIWDASRFGGFKVTDVSIASFSTTVQCPTTLTVQAKVTFEGSGMLSYVWLPGNGRKQDTGRVYVSTSPAYIQHPFHLDATSDSVSGMMTLQVTQPNGVTVQKRYKLRCTAAPPTEPTTSPSPTPPTNP